jgi:hypothetical protein
MNDDTGSPSGSASADRSDEEDSMRKREAALSQEPTPDINERTKGAFGSAADGSKQLISLATGIIALTLTFSKDFVADLGKGERLWLSRAWLALLLSVVAGIWTQYALAGTLGTRKARGYPSIFSRNITWAARVQIASFLAGVSLVIWVGSRAIR